MGLRESIARGILNLAGDKMAGTLVQVLGGVKNKPARRGTKGMLEAYSTMPWLRAVVNKVSRGTASAEWKVYAVKRNGKAVRDFKAQADSPEVRRARIKLLKKEGVLEEITEHPILPVLNGGNEYLIGHLNNQLMQIYLDLVGESFSLKERNGLGVCTALWPVPPHWITDLPRPDFPFFKVNMGAKVVDIPMSEVVWITDPDPVNPYGRGTGVAKVLSDELETDEFAAKHTKHYFYNEARPPIIITADGLGKESTDRLEEGWLKKTQGVMKAYKPFFMNKKVDIHELNTNFRNMQLVDLRKFERDTIVQVFGMSLEMLGIIENSNRATIESAEFLFSKWMLVPRLETPRSAFQARLAPEYDERLIIDYDSPVTEDKEHRLEVMNAAPWAFRVDAWRQSAVSEELEVDAGDVFMLPFNMFPSETITSDVEPPSLTSEPAATDDEKAAIIQLQHEMKATKLTPEQEAKIMVILANISSGVMTASLTPVVAQTTITFGNSTAATIGSSFNQDDVRVQEFILSQTASRVTGKINNTTRKAIRKQMAEGMLAGESIKSLSSRVNNVFDDADSRRSKIIARTETVRAANFGATAAMEQAGIEQKEWLSSRDGAVRESHAPGTGIDGQKVEIGQNFRSPISGAEGPFPGELGVASEDIQCRCTVVPVLERKAVMNEQQKSAVWKTFESERMPLERRMRAASQSAFLKQRQQVLNALSGGN